MKVEIQSFKMEKERWGKNEGKYECKLTLNIGEHSATFLLPPDVGEKIVALCGEVLYEESLKIADNIAKVFEAIIGQKELTEEEMKKLPFIEGAQI